MSLGSRRAVIRLLRASWYSAEVGKKYTPTQTFTRRTCSHDWEQSWASLGMDVGWSNTKKKRAKHKSNRAQKKKRKREKIETRMSKWSPTTKVEEQGCARGRAIAQVQDSKQSKALPRPSQRHGRQWTPAQPGRPQPLGPSEQHAAHTHTGSQITRQPSFSRWLVPQSQCSNQVHCSS